MMDSRGDAFEVQAWTPAAAAAPEGYALAPIGLAATPTLGEQQVSVAVHALSVSAPSLLPAAGADGRARPAAPAGEFSGVMHCPYCRSLTYHVTFRPFEGGLWVKGRCSTCGTAGQSLNEGRPADQCVAARELQPLAR